MKSKKLPNGKLLIKTEWHKFPIEIDAKFIFIVIRDLKSRIDELRNYISYLQEEEPELISVLTDNSYYLDDLTSDDTYKLRYISEDLDTLMENLKNSNDDVKSKEELWDLTDEGFTLSYHDTSRNEYMWEKVLSSIDDQEITEEVYIIDDNILHRKRTIIYDISKPGVKSSISINYDDLPIDDKFMETIRHSINVETVQKNL